jgi:hypothetical protein
MMKLIEEDNFDKQLIPLLEPIIAQSLDMIEQIMNSGEDFSRDEISSLILDLEENFGEYKHLLSSKIYGRIMNINYRLSEFDKTYDSQEKIDE